MTKQSEFILKLKNTVNSLQALEEIDKKRAELILAEITKLAAKFSVAEADQSQAHFLDLFEPKFLAALKGLNPKEVKRLRQMRALLILRDEILEARRVGLMDAKSLSRLIEIVISDERDLLEI